MFWEPLWPSLAPAEAEPPGPHGSAGKGAPCSSLAPGRAGAQPALSRSADKRGQEEEKEGGERRKSSKSRPSRPAASARPRAVRSPGPCRPVPRDARGRSRRRRRPCCRSPHLARPSRAHPSAGAVLAAPPPPQVGPGPPRSPPAAGRARGAGAMAPAPAPERPPPRPAPCPAPAAPQSLPRWKTGTAAAAGGLRRTGETSLPPPPAPRLTWRRRAHRIRGRGGESSAEVC